MARRRQVLRAVAFTGFGLGGCNGGRSTAKAEADIVAGPDSRLTFDPERLTVSAGVSVTWYFDSNGHNVCCVPAHSEVVSLPEGAESFSSYPDGESHRTAGRGETYSNTLTAPGTYTYVCIPHAPSMRGEIRVTE